MTVLLVGLVFVVLGTLAYWVLRNAQDFSDANEVIPGVATNAPKEWAGAHSVEARLHRRLRDAMTALRTNRSLDAPELVDVREALERAALGVDDRLVSVAALSSRHKDARLESVRDAVEAIENAVADVVALRGPTTVDTERGIEQARTRLALVEAARRELESITDGFTGGLPSASALGDLRAGLDAPTDERRSGEPDEGSDPGDGPARPGTPDP